MKRNSIHLIVHNYTDDTTLYVNLITVDMFNMEYITSAKLSQI